MSPPVASATKHTLEYVQRYPAGKSTFPDAHGAVSPALACFAPITILWGVFFSRRFNTGAVCHEFCATGFVEKKNRVVCGNVVPVEQIVHFHVMI